MCSCSTSLLKDKFAHVYVLITPQATKNFQKPIVVSWVIFGFRGRNEDKSGGREQLLWDRFTQEVARSVDRPILVFPLRSATTVHGLLQILNEIVGGAENVSRTSGVLADEVALVLCIEVRVIRQEKNINPRELCGQDFVLRLHTPERVLPQASRIVRAKSGPDF